VNQPTLGLVGSVKRVASSSSISAVKSLLMLVFIQGQRLIEFYGTCVLVESGSKDQDTSKILGRCLGFGFKHS